MTACFELTPCLRVYAYVCTYDGCIHARAEAFSDEHAIDYWFI